MKCDNCHRTIEQIKEGKNYAQSWTDEGILALHQSKCGKPSSQKGKPSPLRGRKQSPELVRKRMVGRSFTDKAREHALRNIAKMIEQNKGSKRSEETKERMREARRRIKDSPPPTTLEIREKNIVLPKKRRKPSNAQSRRMSAAHLRCPPFHAAFLLGYARITEEKERQLSKFCSIYAGIMRRGVPRPENRGDNNPARKPGVGAKIAAAKKRDWANGVYAKNDAKRHDDGKERWVYIFGLPCGRTMFGVAVDLRLRCFRYEGGCDKVHAPPQGWFKRLDWAYPGLLDAYSIEEELKGTLPGVDHETTTASVEDTITIAETILIQRGHDPAKATFFDNIEDIPTISLGRSGPRGGLERGRDELGRFAKGA